MEESRQKREGKHLQTLLQVESGSEGVSTGGAPLHIYSGARAATAGLTSVPGTVNATKARPHK